ncbi:MULTISPECIES: TraM recognition domain-containing protein [Alphaproteobacteria]|uniref:type IV secretory system conjugative DNA transfer family protein n=1 Tax=Alphaproteobacteria TaxID=28211 RepID=UPI0032677D43
MNHSQPNITIIGTTLGRRPGRAFGIKPADRNLHVYALGQTGTGKSTLLLNLIRQDIECERGFCLIDPHGDLAAAVSDMLGPDHLYWNAADPACPYGYNPLTPVGDGYRALVASGIIGTFKKQWVDAWGARMEHLLRYALLALLEHPGASMADIVPLFLDTEFRNEVIDTITDEQVREFWTEEYGALRYKNASDGVVSIANKLGAFLAHPIVRKAVCEPEVPLRFRSIMDEGRVLIVNLAKGRLGGDIANILGGMIASNIAHAAYTRQELPAPMREPFFLYIDEFHSFTTASFVDMLSELRKYRLGLILAHQHTTQLDDATREAILGNVGTLVSFRLGATDAAILARQFAADVPTPRDLVNLGNYEMFVKLMIDGQQSRPFSGITIPPAPTAGRLLGLPKARLERD